MNILAILIPIFLGLGTVGLLAFFWMMKHHHYDDPDGNTNRSLSDRFDDTPAEDMHE